MSAEEEVLNTEDYETSEEFIEDVLGAFDNQKPVFVYGPDYREYGLDAFKEANKKAASENFWNQFSLDPFDWIYPDLYKVSKQETEEGIRINYQKV